MDDACISRQRFLQAKRGICLPPERPAVRPREREGCETAAADDTKSAREVNVRRPARRRSNVGRGDETVTPARERFEIARRAALVAERRPQLLDAGVQTMVEADERSTGPENVAQVVPTDHLARVLDQMLQQCARLRTQYHAAAPPPQFAAFRVEDELPEVVHASRH